MKLKVLNPFIDLLLACCTALLEDETQGPVIQVSNIPELASALMQEGPFVPNGNSSANDRNDLPHEGRTNVALHPIVVCFSADRQPVQATAKSGKLG